MEEAIREVLSQAEAFCIKGIVVDGNDGYRFPSFPLPVKSVIAGDSQIDEIKAASIVAKVVRDALMEEYDSIIP